MSVISPKTPVEPPHRGDNRIYRDPSPEGYRQMQTPEPGQSITPLLLPGVEIMVSELW